MTSQNERNFGAIQPWNDINKQSEQNIRDPFIANAVGGQAEFSSWGLFHSYAWKIRLELVSTLHGIFRRDANSPWLLSDASSMLLNLNYLFVGIFKKEETDQIEKMIDEIDKDINSYMIILKTIRNRPIPKELIDKLKLCYKTLSLYQQLHNLLLPTTRVTDYDSEIKRFENTIIEN